MRNSFFLSLMAALTISFTSALVGCGGGSSDSYGKTNRECKSSQQSDVWINNRLGCAAVGQQYVAESKNATGTRVDRAFGVAQISYDDQGGALNSGKTRYFNYFVCVIGVPDQVVPADIAGDLQFLLALAYTSHYLPPGISLTALAVGGSGATGVPYVDQPCDPMRNPVIVDYASGLVQSINPSGLANLTIYDK